MARVLSTGFESPDYFSGQRNWGWAGLFLFISTLLGLAVLMVPIHWLIGGLALLAVLAWLAMNPLKLFYLAIFTIPFTDRVRVLPISFSLNDLVILFCAISVLFHVIFMGWRTNIRTSLDGWILLLTLMFFLAGLFSESETGLLGFFKIFEAMIVYYMAVIFIRTRHATRSQIIKALLFTALAQSALGIFQSFTGIGADFQSNRGYLGYLGLGSSKVWHGRGTTWHFNTLGNYLVANLLFFIPMGIYMVKRRAWAMMLGGVILFGIITTYSRGSLLGLVAGLLFCLIVIQSNWRRAMFFSAAFVLLIILPVVMTLGSSSYVETLSYNDRLTVWQIPIAAITSSDKAFWFGSGLNAYSVVAWPHIPAWVPPEQYKNWFAHNFYLLTIIEVGVIGAIVLFSFLTYLWLDTWRKFKKWHGFMRIYSLSISMTMLMVFFVSIFDHTFATPHFKVFLFLLLGLLYVKRNPVSKKRWAGY